MQAALAAAPLAAVILAMTVLHWKAALAGAGGLAVAIALLVAQPPAAPAMALLMGGSALEALSSTVTILWIILPALVLFEFQSRAGALDRIRAALVRISARRSMQVLLIAWFFGLFMEGAAGFGTPVALAAPLLVGLGYGPVRAVALALIGHAAGVSFGAVGTPVIAQAAATGLDAGAIATVTATLHLGVSGGLVLALLWLAEGKRPDRATLGMGALAAGCFLLPAVALAALTGPELPTLGGALIGGAAFVALLRRKSGAPLRTGWRAADLAPYALVVALVLITRLVPPVQQALAGFQLEWTLAAGDFRGGLQPLHHPGTLMAVALCAAALWTGRAALLGPAVRAALARLMPVALALMIMLMLARLMVHGGMIATLAQAATGAGAFWPLLAPLIGVLGTFVTGSATASNILFSDFQVETAQALALPTTVIAAAQSFGAAIGNTIAPHNIIAGSATVGLTAREGEVLARTLLPATATALAGGGLAAIMVLII